MKHKKECHLYNCKNRTKDHIYMDFHKCTCMTKHTENKTIEKGGKYDKR